MKPRSEKRQQYIVTRIENTYSILEDLENKPHTSFSELMEISKLRGGSFSSALADSRNLGFVSNGKGFSLTELGLEYLKTKSKDILKQQALKLPFFRKIHESLGEIASYNAIKQWVEKNKGDLFANQFIGSVASRYYESIKGYSPKTEIIQNKLVFKSERPQPMTRVTKSLKINPEIWKKAKIKAIGKDIELSAYIEGLIEKDLKLK